MRYKFKPKKDLTVWHDWFAWFPLITQHEFVWFEYVERKYTNGLSFTVDDQGYCHPVGGFEYRVKSK